MVSPLRRAPREESCDAQRRIRGVQIENTTLPAGALSMHRVRPDGSASEMISLPENLLAED